jgi:hypothetical protein
MTVATGAPAIDLHDSRDDNWLTVIADSNCSMTRGLPWRLLKLNGRLRGGARFAVDPASCAVEIRADVSLSGHRGMTTTISEARAAVVRAGVLLAHRSDRRIASRVRRKVPPPAARPQWRDLLAESGWDFEERDGHHLTVDLGVSWGQFHAVVSDVGPMLRCELRRGSTTAASQEALALFLLTASHDLRLVRPVAALTARGHSIRLEVGLPTKPDAENVDLALGALACACGSVGRESQALADEVVATAYLAMRGIEGHRQRWHSAVRAMRDVETSTIGG